MTIYGQYVMYMLYDIIILKPSTSFSVTLWLVIMSSDVWQCDHDITLTLTLNPNKEKKKKRELNKKASI